MRGPNSFFVAVLLLSASALAQVGDPKISGAPGGVPVPPVPAAATSASVAADLSTLSHTFRVRVVDGRNGLPVERARLRLWYDEPGGTAFSLMTNAQGIALMPAPVGTPVRVLVTPDDRMDCRLPPNSAKPSLDGYNVAALAASGTVSANRCGRVGEKPRPGELVLFVRPLRWYEGLNRP